MATVSNRKFAVVTGASTGIGFALAGQCLENGYDVLVCADTEMIARAAQRLETPGALVYQVQEDLSTPEGVERLYQRIVDIGRPVDALMLNAGVGLGGAFLDMPLDAELRMIALNCGHTVHLAKRVVSDMVANRSGRVLVTGSLSTTPNPYQAVYGATKAFVYSFGEAIREELEGTGVTVTLLQPGATESDFFERAGMENTQLGREARDSAEQVAREGFAAMVAGQSSVIAGNVEEGLDEVLPDSITARMLSEPKPKPGH